MNQDLLKYCRYYKGEKECPYEGIEFYRCWNTERVWVERMLDRTYEFKDELHEYITAGLVDFEKYDDTPITLKALLFNRFGDWFSGGLMEMVEPFKKYYQEYMRR
jgi:hypothetical protein